MVTAVQQNIYSSLASHEELQGIAFESGIYHRLAGKILKDAGRFKDHPSSIQYLKPKAKLYHELLDAAQASPLKQTLEKLRYAHIDFTNSYIDEFETVFPTDPSVINVKYARTIRLFADVIKKHFTPEQIAEKDLLIFARTPKLAVQELLDDPKLAVPEIFNEDEIANLRAGNGDIILSKIMIASKEVMNAIYQGIWNLSE